MSDVDTGKYEMTEKNLDFFNDHSRQFLEMALDHQRSEMIKHPDGYGKNTGECGDTIEIFLMIRDNRIEHVSFITDGCINTHACANTVAHMVEGKTVSDAWKITHDTVIDFLETLPQEFYHCAELAVGALYLSLKNYQALRQNPGGKQSPDNF